MRKIITFFVSLLLFSFLFFHPSFAYSTILFQDNFDNATESATNWEVVGPQMYNGDGSLANWTFKNGMYGMTINGRGSQFNESVPTGTNWNDSWKNYIFEVDFILGEGPNPSYKPVDTNLVFRYIDHGKWYGIHGINDENKLVLQKAAVQAWSSTPPVRAFRYEYNTPYRIKVRVENEHISIWIKNKLTDTENLMWDITDLGTILDHGKPGLQASTGANPYSDVWFDNVVVTSLDEPTPTPTATPTPTNTPTPTPTPPTPIVFLPGLGGSINFEEMFLGDSNPGGWRMTPGAKVYDNLLKAFEGNPDFHVFYYDWRRPVTENAQKLHDFIQNTVIPPENKVDLVGHSLGGLVARACIQKNTDHCFTDKLITVGSPNFGAIDAYPALEGGEIWRTGPTKLGYELLVHYFQQPGETRRETIERIAPVLKDLLPNFDYLTKNSTNLPPSSLSFQNSLLPNLSDLSSLINLTKTITGRGFNTVEQIILTEPNWVDKLLGNWPDGKPIDKLLTLEGDNSVLTKSSSFSGSLIENFTYNLDHGGIISEQVPLTKIMEILGLELNPGTYNSLTDEENFLVFLVHSPVKISSLDVTPDSFTTDELIIIPSPENKNYTLNVEGIGDGYYSLSVGQIFGEKVFWNDYFDETYNGKNQTFNLSVNPQSPSENPLLDPSGTSTTNQLNSRINEFKKEVQDLKINLKYKKALINQLNKIQNQAKNPQKAFSLFTALRQIIVTYENQGIIGHEMANIFREKSSGIADSLEFLSFLKPQKTNKFEAQAAIKAAEKVRNSVKQEKLNRNGALVFIDAQEKLDKANLVLGKAEYYRAKIFALEATQLFLESKMIK